MTWILTFKFSEMSSRESRQVCVTYVDDFFSSLLVLLASRDETICSGSHVSSPPGRHLSTEKSQIYLQNTFRTWLHHISMVTTLVCMMLSLAWLDNHNTLLTVSWLLYLTLGFSLKPEARGLCLKHKWESLLCSVPSLLTHVRAKVAE